MKTGFFNFLSTFSVVPPVLLSVFNQLISFWDFDESGGSAVIDKVGTRDLARSGTQVVWDLSDPKNGQACVEIVTASSSSSLVSDVGLLDFTDSSFAFFGWIRPDAEPASSGAWMHIFGRYAPAAGARQYALRLLPDMQLSWFLRDTAETIIEVLTPVDAVVLGEWALVAAECDFDAGVARIYVNGVLAGSTALTANPLQSGGGARAFRCFNLDAAATTNIYVGAIDSLGVCNAALNADQHAALYAAGAGYYYESLRYAAGVGTYAAPGVWTWFNDPRAIVLGDNVVVGALTMDGAPTAYVFPDSGPQAPEFRMLPNFQIDDHNNPSFLVRSSDSRVLAFFSAHPGGLRVALSTNPNSVAEFGAPANINTSIGIGVPGLSYANAYELTGEVGSPIYLFTRFGNSSATWKQVFTVSTDQGATWATAQDFLTTVNDRPYLKMAQNGNARIDFLVTDGHPRDFATNSVYHFYYEGGDYYKSDGTLISASLPFTPADDLTLVYDGSSVRAWIWDIQIDGLGNPAIIYATFPSTTDHRYHRAVWNGSAWVSSEICAAGGYLYAAEDYYSGGACFDPDDFNVVYASREVSGVHQLYRCETADGVSWSVEELLATSNKKFRPYVPLGSRSLLYVEGVYNSYVSYRCSIKSLAI